MMSRRILESIAMLMIGEGVLAMISPRRHLALWQAGPRWWERMMKPLVGRPRMIRVLGFLEFGAGVMLAWREAPPVLPQPLHKNHRWTTRLAQAMR